MSLNEISNVVTCPFFCSESLYEDEEFDQRQLAALVASKVFFYLGELNDALSYALGAGALFDVSDDSDYAQTLLGERSHLHYDKFLDSDCHC